VEVTRHDVYDFFVELTEKRFNDVKRIADAWEVSIEQAFSDVVEHGIDVLLDGLKGKES